MRNSDGQLCFMPVVSDLSSFSKFTQISFPSCQEMDKFHGFPTFPLLFWHERFVPTCRGCVCFAII